jgi:hypothetical protein
MISCDIASLLYVFAWKEVNHLFWSFLAQLEKEDKIFLNYLCKLCWIFVGMFNKEFSLVMYIKFPKIYPMFVCLRISSMFFLSFLEHFWCCSIETLMKNEKLYAVLMLFCFFYKYQLKTIPFCKKIIMTLSKQHTSCIWAAQGFFLLLI